MRPPLIYRGPCGWWHYRTHYCRTCIALDDYRRTQDHT